MAFSGSESFDLHSNASERTLESMNMEEFLANIWNNEEGLIAGPSAAPAPPLVAPTSPVPFDAPAPPLVAPLLDVHVVAVYEGVGGFLAQPAPPPSPVNPGPLLADGRDEGGVLNPYHIEIRAHLINVAGFGLPDDLPWPEVHQEVSLEEFLERAGLQFADPNSEAAAAAAAAAAIIAANADSSPPQTPQHSELSYQSPAALSEAGESSLRLENMLVPRDYHEQQPLMAAAMATSVNGMGNLVGNGYGIGSPLNQGGMASEGMGGGEGEYSAATSVYGAAAGEARLRGRDSGKRPVEDEAAETSDKRQKRMIKNRESAARSRARKQAYILELEAELTKLREEHSKLLQEKHWMINTENKMLWGSLAGPAIEKKAAGKPLRRCYSSSWKG